MIKRIRVNKFNQHLRNSFLTIIYFPGTSTNVLLHQTISTLVDENSNCFIIHGGCYSIEKRVATDQSIKNSVIDLGNK